MPDERTHDTVTIAKVLLLTPRRVRQLTVDGIFFRARDAGGEELRGRYALIPTVHCYIKYLREGRLDDPREADLTRSRSRLALVRAQEAELRLAALQRKMHHAEDVEFIITQIYTAIRSTLLAIPSRTARLLVGKTDLHSIILILNAEIEHALNELVEINAAMFAKQNEAYLEKVFPEPAPKAANGNGDSGAGIESDAFDSD
jgi:phage terminase Nu1 subunit (DNA packaging protein)